MVADYWRPADRTSKKVGHLTILPEVNVMITGSSTKIVIDAVGSDKLNCCVRITCIGDRLKVAPRNYLVRFRQNGFLSSTRAPKDLFPTSIFYILLNVTRSGGDPRVWRRSLCAKDHSRSGYASIVLAAGAHNSNNYGVLLTGTCPLPFTGSNSR